MNSSAASPKMQGLYGHQQRVIGWAMLPLALTLVVAAAAAIYLVHQQMVTFAQQKVDGMAAEVDSNLRRHLQGMKALAATSAMPTPLKGIDALHADAVAYEQAIGFPVLLADERRHILLSSERPPGQPLPDLPTAHGLSALDVALRTGEPQISNVVHWPITSRQVIAVVMPAPELPGTRAWISGLPTDRWQRRLDREPIAAGWTVVLRDGDGQTIAARGPDITAATQDPSSGWRFTAQSRQVPWTAVIHASWWTFLQPQLRMATALLLILAAVGGGALWLARRSSRKLHAAIAQLGNIVIPSEATHGPIPRILEVEAVRQELHRLQSAVHEAERKERQRIARELHDGLQQYLAASQMSVELAYDRIAAHDPDAARLLQDSSRNSRHVLNELHLIINKLRPSSLSQLGLLPALEHLVAAVADSTGLQIELETVGPTHRLDGLPETLGDCLYRAVQECLNNVRKHARATFVHVVVDVSDPRHLMLQVSDDGVGLSVDAQDPTQGYGLLGMQERVRAMRGSIDITRGHDGDPTRGTTVRAQCPIPQEGA